MGKYDNDGFDDDDFEDSSEGFKKLRAALKKANERNTAQAEEIKTLSGKVSRVTVKDVLTAKKANPAIGRFILADGVDVTNEVAVDEWLQENGSLFGYTPAPASAGEGQAAEQPAAPESSLAGRSELVDEYTRLRHASEGAQPVAVGADALKRLMAAEDPDALQAALDAALAQQGAGGN